MRPGTNSSTIFPEQSLNWCAKVSNAATPAGTGHDSASQVHEAKRMLLTGLFPVCVRWCRLAAVSELGTHLAGRQHGMYEIPYPGDRMAR